MIVKHRWLGWVGQLVILTFLIQTFLDGGQVPAATYHVDQGVPTAADANPGTEAAPWKTIGRAAAAEELKPGDTVLIHTGVYREHVEVKVSGGVGQADHIRRRAGAPCRGQGIGGGARRVDPAGWTGRAQGALSQRVCRCLEDRTGRGLLHRRTFPGLLPGQVPALGFAGLRSTTTGRSSGSALTPSTRTKRVCNWPRSGGAWTT